MIHVHIIHIKLVHIHIHVQKLIQHIVKVKDKYSMNYQEHCQDVLMNVHL